jgi:hypothetical protein
MFTMGMSFRKSASSFHFLRCIIEIYKELRDSNEPPPSQSPKKSECMFASLTLWKRGEEKDTRKEGWGFLVFTIVFHHLTFGNRERKERAEDLVDSRCQVGVYRQLRSSKVVVTVEMFCVRLRSTFSVGFDSDVMTDTDTWGSTEHR